MGTVFSVSIEDDIASEILTDISNWWEHVEQTFSTFRPDSQIDLPAR
jgi:thiamine biosynthesis lipoprotein ApbE